MLVLIGTTTVLLAGTVELVTFVVVVVVMVVLIVTVGITVVAVVFVALACWVTWLLLNTSGPVSYTHLDVYKRQVLV